MTTPNLISTESVKLKVRAVLDLITEDLKFMALRDPLRKSEKFLGARHALKKIRKKLKEEFYL